MNFLLILIIILVSEAGILWYLSESEFFRPYLESGEANITNVLIFISLIASFGGVFFALVTYLGEKFIYCGRREFPRSSRAIRVGLIVFLCLLALLLLHIFHLLNFQFALLLIIFVIILGIVIS
jgi:hypothetical protein